MMPSTRYVPSSGGRGLPSANIVDRRVWAPGGRTAADRWSAGLPDPERAAPVVWASIMGGFVRSVLAS